MFKFKITPDRHNAIQNLNYCLLPDPPLFSLPSTFKLTLANILDFCYSVLLAFLIIIFFIVDSFQNLQNIYNFHCATWTSNLCCCSHSSLDTASLSKYCILFLQQFWTGLLCTVEYCIQQCFICCPSDSTVPEDAGIESRIVCDFSIGSQTF